MEMNSNDLGEPYRNHTIEEFHFIRLLQNNQDRIIHKWINEFYQCCPEIYDETSLYLGARRFFSFMMDIDIPIEKHDHIKSVPDFCEAYLSKNLSIRHVLHSVLIWRNSVLLYIEEEQNNQVIPFRVVRKINLRLDQYALYIFDYYNEMTKRQLEEKKSTISKLHEARMTDLGKMAASMAHEIRNPLTSILGFVKLMREQISSHSYEKLTSYLDIIEVEFQNIQMQISGMLSFSKKELKEEPFADVSLTTVIDSVVSLIIPRLVNENISLTIETIQNVKINIQKIGIQQVLSNILNNSIDALYQTTKVEREITISSWIEGDIYKLALSNNGPEIPSEIKDSLFFPFVTSKTDGTGLGLAICKQIMNKNNGDVTFTSDTKQTVFVISFKLKGDLTNSEFG
ncbi:sensor histidine kinase [Paenibacillus agricola]|uniref:histidine kinase n=1 Tax=Paenibacillus agricola TaxID=2716264 RepID=A0ABX0J5S4_9BACL|nr:HAMP domain-containing sensor histidine kinase [Paenibacillus agricola]NHN30751.1 HAMP domain-containing histidine kinase [Paenibacillus agricola]